MLRSAFVISLAACGAALALDPAQPASKDGGSKVTWKKTVLDDKFHSEGVAVADVPNLFFLLGPNTGLGHTSVVIMIEAQIRYVAEAIAAVDKRGAQALAPTREAQDRDNAELQQRLARSVWNTGGCRSWYLDEHGVNRTLWSGMTWEYWRHMRKLRPSEYKFLGVKAPAEVA